MNLSNYKHLLPHLIAVVSIIVVCFIYCFPVMQGKVLVQSDIVKNRSQAHELREYREKNHEETLWTTRVFSGMTTFNLGADYHTNILKIAGWFRSLFPEGVNIMIISMLGFYLLLVAMGMSSWLALLGAIAYGLSSNLLVSLMAGHNTKVLSIAYMAPALGGLALAFNGKLKTGALLTAVFVGLMVFGNHFQIMYYYILISIIAGGVYLFFAIKEKTIKQFATTVGILVISGIIGFLPNFGKVYNVYEHSKDTIRGGKKYLTNKEKKDEGGLGKDYAMAWSYGPFESFTILVPSVMGGASQEELPANGALAELAGRRSSKDPIIGPTYIGEQTFTLGPVYFGAGFIFLFLLSLFIVKDRTRIWLLGATLLSFFIAWGKHFDLFTGFMFEYFPLYNKFRTPSMALCIAGITMPWLGLAALNRIIKGEVQGEEFKKAFKYAVYVMLGLMVVLLLYGLTSSWTGSADEALQTKKPWNNPEVFAALVEDRKSLFMHDWFIGIVLLGLTIGSIWLFSRNTIKVGTLVLIIGLISVGDMWRVSKRYFNDSNFVSENQYDGQFRPSGADSRILADKDPHFRVVNLASRNPWTDGTTCYFHENIGGHHAAKLQRYQDMIENQLGNQLQIINKAVLQSPQGLFMDPSVSKGMTAYNMLNTKYYIVKDNEAGVIENPTACGNAWFVNDIKLVPTHDEEMAAISEIDPLNTAIIHEEFKDALGSFQPARSDDASIELTELKPNYLSYKSHNTADGLAVFSEVIYPNGWIATIDGQPVDIYRANYILRAIKVPAGDHVIEMKFEPASYAFGENVSLAGSIMMVLFAGGMIYFLYKKSTTEASENA